MQNRGRIRHKSGIKQLIIKHISENINLYIKVFIIFIIGICIGIAVVNNLPETEIKNTYDYIQNSVDVLKNKSEISKFQILKSSLFKNVLIVFLIWLFGLTVVGNFILYILILVLGITFGYTLASIMVSFTFIQGILFFLTTMLLQNIINIPAILFLIIQGFKSHHLLVHKQNTSTRYILTRYTAYSFIVMIFLVIASFVEVYISGNLVYSIAKYL